MDLNECLALKPKERKLYQELKIKNPKEIFEIEIEILKEINGVGEKTLKRLKRKTRWVMKNWGNLKKKFLATPLNLEGIIEVMEEWVSICANGYFQRERNLKILRGRFQEGKTFYALGKEFRCSRQGIHQIYKKNIERTFSTLCWAEIFAEYSFIHFRGIFQKNCSLEKCLEGKGIFGEEKKRWKKMLDFWRKIILKFENFDSLGKIYFSSEI